MGFEGIGASVRRKEDVRFLSGRGTYTDDVNRPGQLYAYIRRSDRPHLRRRSINVAAAKASPGVVAVFTGADMQADNIGGLPCGWQIHRKDGVPMAEPPHPVLAVGKARHVGDPVAVVSWSPGSMRPHSTTRTTSPSRAAAISARWRSTPRPATCSW